MPDLKTAENVARILRRHPYVHDVLVFGSIARDGKGRDIDLAIVTEDALADDFVEMTENALLYREGVYGAAALRLRTASWALGPKFRGTLREVYREVGHCDLDVFVFPHDWRDRLDELQNAFPHEDPNFMANIARDACQVV